MQKALKQIDFSKTLVWDSGDCVEQFHHLVENPPHHSVVIHFEPIAAKRIVELSNTKNRPLAQASAARFAREAEAEEYDLTGDTIKFSKTGRLLDGQHRLTGCAAQAAPIVSHVVFGLADDIFDVLDQGRKRTPGDVLAMCGVAEYNLVAAAVRQAMLISEGRKGWDTGGAGKVKNRPPLSARKIRELATGPMRGILNYTKDGKLIADAFKHPASMVTAILYLIGQHDKATALAFAADWQHGNRNYQKNRNFDTLASRIQTIQGQGGGHLNRAVRCALIVQCFNHWNAGVAAAPRALTWRREWVFPQLAFDKEAFLATKEAAHWSDSSLRASQERLLEAMRTAAEATGTVTMPVNDLAKKSNVPPRQLSYVLRTLLTDRAIYIHRKGVAGKPHTYRIAA